MRFICLSSSSFTCLSQYTCPRQIVYFLYPPDISFLLRPDTISPRPRVLCFLLITPCVQLCYYLLSTPCSYIYLLYFIIYPSIRSDVFVCCFLVCFFSRFVTVTFFFVCVYCFYIFLIAFCFLFLFITCVTVYLLLVAVYWMIFRFCCLFFIKIL